MQSTHASVSSYSRSRQLDTLPPKATRKPGGGRPSGWTPLVYPASALMEDSAIPGNDPESRNPYFPLHPHVLRAAVRELLILNGDVNGETLQLKNAIELPSKSGWKNHVVQGIRRVQNPRKKRKTTKQSEDRVDTAEALVNATIRHALLLPEEESTEALVARPMPRKVSDASDGLRLVDRPGNELTPPDLLDRDESRSEISRFVDLNSHAEDGSFLLRTSRMAAMLEVSIASETMLKASCLKMTNQLLSSFDEKPLRMFFGYKSSALKSDRLRRLFSDFLFDTSHALFAWEQTERELLSELDPSAVPRNWDETIRDSLFNERALRKIGGFDDSSLLRHAISILRLASTGTSWAKFAMTVEGKRLLRHHRCNGDMVTVGQQRRGQRIRRAHSDPISDQSSDEEEWRSRSSSVASLDDIVHRRVGATKAEQVGVSFAEHLGITQGTGIESVTLQKDPGSSWGILLSKEGQLCVVVRTPDELNGLQAGDIIMSVKDESGDSVHPLSEADSDWFRRIVSLFKASDTLRLSVRRVAT